MQDRPALARGQCPRDLHHRKQTRRPRQDLQGVGRRRQLGLRHLHRPVQPLHPLRGVGGGVHPGLPAEQRLRHPARHDPRRHARGVATGVRPGRDPRLRSAAPDTELARPELLPARPGRPLPAHRLAVRGQRDRLGPALDITDAANVLAAEGHAADTGDLATISPYVTRTIRRFGDWVLDLAPPAGAPSTRLDLEPRVLFPAGRA